MYHIEIAKKQRPKAKGTFCRQSKNKNKTKKPHITQKRMG